MNEVQQLPEQYLQGEALRAWSTSLRYEKDLVDTTSVYAAQKTESANNAEQYITRALEEFQCNIQPLVLKQEYVTNQIPQFWMQVWSPLHGTPQGASDVKNATQYINDILKNFNCTIIPVRNDNEPEGFSPTIVTLW